LLHTWSLSVEEQFYVFWPAFLWLVARNTGRRWHPYLFASLGIVSLVLNYVWVTGNFDANYASSLFFLTPFRMFELSMGAMALYAAPIVASRRWLCEIGMAAGLGLIGYTAFAYSDDLVFPYYYALIPCVGAFLVIVSGRSALFGWLLTNRVAVGIGVISYSLYLVHWPALIFYEQYKFGELNRVEYVAGFGLTIALAALMYFAVEKPFRRNAPTRSNRAPQRTFVLSSLGTMAVLGAIGVHVGTSDGWVWRNPNAMMATEIADGKQRRFNLVQAGCQITGLENRTLCKVERPAQILVFGDSHEVEGYNAMAAIYGGDPAVNLISFGAFNGCDVQFKASVPFSTVDGCSARVALLNDARFVGSLTGGFHQH
jgi:Acyltransferase family